jgi:hypothetical protein
LLITISQGWSLLSLYHQGLWNAFAALHTRQNMFGQTKKISGFNWYQVINSNRQAVGLSLLNLPPTYATALPIINISAVVVDDTILLALDDPQQTDPTHTYIYTSPPLRGITNYYQSSLRLTYVAPETEYEDVDITEQWKEVHKLNFPPSASCAFSFAVLAYPVLDASGIPLSGFGVVCNHVT